MSAGWLSEWFSAPLAPLAEGRARGRRCRPPHKWRRGPTLTLSWQSRSRAHRGARRDLICKAGNQPMSPPPLPGHQAPGVPDEPITVCD
jgi:hypothetical protein